MSEQLVMPIEGLVLVRLMRPINKAKTFKEIVKPIEPIIGLSYTVHECAGQVETAIKDLIEKQAVFEDRSTKTLRYKLTKTGKGLAEEFLGAEYYPKKLDWRDIKEKYLPAAAVGLRIRSQSDFRNAKQRVFALLLTQELKLPLKGAISKLQALDAIFWKVLGIDSNKPFTKTAAKPYFIQKLLDFEGELTGKSAENVLMAKLANASNSTDDAIQLSIIHRLIKKRKIPVESEILIPQTSITTVSLDGFVKLAKSAAERCATGRFGTGKVFINHVWRNCQKLDSSLGMNLEDFKRRLLEAHRERKITLSPADLPDFQDERDVSESEIKYYNTAFHYIRI